MPSAELREAIVSFRAALKDAVDVVIAREKVYKALDATLHKRRENKNLSEETHVDKAEGTATKPVIKSNEDAEDNVEDTNDKEGEWQLVR